jgi:hypothetical protein
MKYATSENEGSEGKNLSKILKRQSISYNDENILK